MRDGGTVITPRVPSSGSDGRDETRLRSRTYSPGEVFRPTCPNPWCATSCEPDALYCVECGARLYTLESGRYGERT
jgi:hypothetical protein